MNALIQNRKKKIEEFCKAWNVRELQVFGSVLRNDFNPDSDIDIIVDFLPGSSHTLIHLAQMEEELEHIFNRRIDLITRRCVRFFICQYNLSSFFNILMQVSDAQFLARNKIKFFLSPMAGM